MGEPHQNQQGNPRNVAAVDTVAGATPVLADRVPDRAHPSLHALARLLARQAARQWLREP